MTVIKGKYETPRGELGHAPDLHLKMTHSGGAWVQVGHPFSLPIEVDSAQIVSWRGDGEVVMWKESKEKVGDKFWFWYTRLVGGDFLVIWNAEIDGVYHVRTVTLLRMKELPISNTK